MYVCLCGSIYSTPPQESWEMLAWSRHWSARQ